MNASAMQKEVHFCGTLKDGRQALVITQPPKKEERADPALDLFTIYDSEKFCEYAAGVADKILKVGQKVRFDDFRSCCIYRPANKNWWGRSLSATLRARGIVGSGEYVKSKIAECKGGRTPVLIRIA
jgi:hypothetical protein